MLFWPPTRRAARGPVRGCRPSEAPSALPPDDPAGFRISSLPRGSRTGFSISRHFARAARLLLRELPSLWSGDLPARRAMPLYAFALNEELERLSAWGLVAAKI